MNFEKLHALYHRPLLNLISQSREIHLEHWRGEEVQRCSLLSIKTGGCSEDIQFSLTVNNPFAEILYNVSGFKQHPGRARGWIGSLAKIARRVMKLI
jgi:hypothetical protein